MNSRALRRLATDHGALHSQSLPPNYLFQPGATVNDDLTQLDILLTGPTHTPFAAGVWKLHLAIPTTYPQQPPTANFRTPIFHPNVEPQTGGVCVETLKRDWDSKLTLRDVLVTICCLLIQPNPDSALNAEAGALIQEDYAAFAERAKLMTSIHAGTPKSLADAVKEAQNRGQEEEIVVLEDEPEQKHPSNAPIRRRRVTTRQRGAATTRRSDGSPSGGVASRRIQPALVNPFVVQSRTDDVFGSSSRAVQDGSMLVGDVDSSMTDADQENEESRSPAKAHTPKVATPRRPPGVAVPLGEITLEDAMEESSEDDTEPEYPPSPRKSPVKSSVKIRAHPNYDSHDSEQAESSRTAAARAPNITPPTNFFTKPLAEKSPFVDSSFLAEPSASPRKQSGMLFIPGPVRGPLFPTLATPQGIFKPRSPSSSQKRREAELRQEQLEAKLWDMCGRDVGRWNRGDFDGEPFKVKARRW